MALEEDEISQKELLANLEAEERTVEDNLIEEGGNIMQEKEEKKSLLLFPADVQDPSMLQLEPKPKTSLTTGKTFHHTFSHNICP